MGEGPPEPPCRWRFQTTVCCCSPMRMVVSDTGKGPTRWDQVSDMETNKSESLITCRKRRNAIKTGRESLARDKHGGYLIREESIKNPKVGLSFPITVHAVTGMEATSTYHRLRSGTWEPACRWKGRKPSGRTARFRVPMRHAGTEQPVVVVKPLNRGGAKGLCYPASHMDQPEGKNP